MDGKNSVCPGGDGRQCGRSHRTRLADIARGTCLLLGHLPYGCLSGYSGLAGQTQQAQPLHSVGRQDLAAVDGAGAIRHRHAGGHRFVCGSHLALQFLRTHRFQSLCPTLWMVQQSDGLLRRARRQLYILRDIGLAQKPAYADYHSRDVRRHRISGMAKRQDLLQHCLPGRHCAGISG